MTRFYFNVRHSTGVVPDPEGVELPDLEAAKREALQSAREIMSEQVKFGDVIDARKFEITDANGSVYATIPFRMALRLT